MEKDRLKGINISSELALLNIFGFDNFVISVSPLFQAFKKNKINIPFLSTSFSDRRMAAVSCCCSKKDVNPVKELIQQNHGFQGNSCFTHGVGLLSIFPHRSSLNFLGLSLSALEGANLSLLGMSSSISSLIFVLKFNQLGKAVDSLKGYFSHDRGHTLK